MDEKERDLLLDRLRVRGGREMTNCEIAERVTSLMNELLELDPSAVRELIDSRVGCDDRIANHPHVQVMSDEGGCRLGVMGILNGLIGSDGKRFVSANFDNDGNLIGFSHTVMDHENER
jgi:hypothetical protein